MFPSKDEKNKDKGITLKACKKETSVSDDEFEIDSEDIALFARKFRKFLKTNKEKLKNDYEKFDKSKYM